MNKQQLIEDNMNLVYYTIQKYYPTFSKNEDIIQTGMVGLCKAAETWDGSKSKFSTYAIKCILNEIRMEFRNQKKQIKAISLETLISREEEDIGTMENLIIGENDVGYVDVDGFYSTLTPKQKEIFDLLQLGLSVKEIAKKLDKSYQSVAKIERHLRWKWRNQIGN